jgi:hypothetical protein
VWLVEVTLPTQRKKYATYSGHLINAIKAQTSGQIVFELKIRTETMADYKSVLTYLDCRGLEFYTFDANSGQ